MYLAVLAISKNIFFVLFLIEIELCTKSWRMVYCALCHFHQEISFDLVSIGRYIYFIAIELKLANKYVFTSPSVNGVYRTIYISVLLLPSFIVYVYFSSLPVWHSLCTSFLVSIVIDFGRKREIGNSSVPKIQLHILSIDLFERNEKWGKTHNRTTSQMIPFQFPFFSLLFFYLLSALLVS